MSESVRLTVDTITRPFLFQNTGCLNYPPGEDGPVQPAPKGQVTSQGAIPPMFTLGNQCILLGFLAKRRLGGVTFWSVGAPPQKATPGHFYPAGMIALLTLIDGVPSPSPSGPIHSSPSPRLCALRAEEHTAGDTEQLDTQERVS